MVRSARLIVFMLTVTTVVTACNSLVGFSELTRVNETLPETRDGGSPKRDGSTDGDGEGEDEDGDDGEENLDAGPVDPAERDAALPPASTVCPAATPKFYPPFVPPIVPSPRPCKSGDLSAFLASELKPYDTQKASMTGRNPACAECIYKTQSDSVWGPMTRTFDQRTFVDFGLCYEAAGARRACAEAAHNAEWCMQKVCNVCTSGLSLANCRASAFGVGGECEPQANDEIDACADDGDIVNDICRSSREVVGILCGGL